MKQAKRLLVLLLVLALTAALTIPAFAAGTDPDGSITINNATVGQTYKIYKVFDATFSGDNVAYTYTKTNDSETKEDALYNALTATTVDDVDEGKTVSPFTLTPTATEGVYNVSTQSDGATVGKWLKENETLLTKTNEKTATSQTVEFTGLDYGYYYITSSLGSAVTITKTTPSAVVQDKNQEPGKPDGDGYKIIVDENGNKLTDNSVNFGDTVYYVLQAKATNYDGEKQITKYVAHDELGAGLEDLKVTKVVVINNDDTTTNREKELQKDTEYTVAVSTSESSLEDNCSLEVTILWTSTGEDGEITSLYNANSTIKIYVEATVKDTATIGPDVEGQTSNLTNTGWFTWQDTNGQDINPDPSNEKTTVTSHTYAIAIYKTDEKETAVPGAKFEIKDKDGNKVPVKATTEDGVYEYDPTDYEGEYDANYTVVSPDSGIIIVKGINAAGAYTIHETEAPAGYIVLDQDVTVEATELTSSTTSTIIYKDADGKITDTKTENETKIEFNVAAAAVNVINKTGTTLPSTGGMGTTLFYIIGGVLVLAAVVLLVTKKRLSADR